MTERSKDLNELLGSSILSVVVLCRHAYKRRLIDYFKVEYHCSVQYSGHEILVFKPAISHMELVKKLQNDDIPRKALEHVLFCRNYSESWDSVIYFEELFQSHLCFRMQTFPTKLKQRLIQTLPEEVDLQPRSFTHALHVVELEGMYLWGVWAKEWNLHTSILNSEPPHISRAFYKMKEVLQRCEIPLKKRCGCLLCVS